MKSKNIAAILAFFLGGLGVHKFYIGKTMQGIFYLVFCWTYISTIISFIECITYLFMSQQEFDAKFVKSKQHPTSYSKSKVQLPTSTKKNRFIEANEEKGIKNCPNCKAENNVNNNFCEYCGTKL